MRTIQRYSLLCGIFVSLVTLLFIVRIFTKYEDVKIQNYLVNTSVCKIPEVDPFDATVKYIIGARDIIKCERFPIFTYESNRNIYINWTQVNESSFEGKLDHCRIRPIVRPVNKTSDHNSLAYLEQSPPFKNSIATNSEHIHVKCYDKKQTFLFQNFHTIILEKTDVETRCDNNKSKIRQLHPENEKPLSVQIIVVDSVSRLNSIRFMERTRNFLLNKMDAVDMMGYNKVGYGTFHNMVPVLAGKFYQELPYSFRSPTSFDNFTFLWDLYSNHGFRTYYAEDYPMGTMFDYNKMGFHKTPTDYYNRHLLLSMYQQPDTVYNKENCILHQLQTQWILDPAYKFLKVFRNKSYFSIILLTRLTHDKLERTATADELYINFFKNINENNLFNNTVLVFMADHGMRFGPIRESYIGLLEERLPMLYIALPKWFSRKYPLHMANLKLNSRRLTTPFDLHKTLVDFLSFNGTLVTNSISKRGLNLFSEIPENRRCTDAHIEPHWCTCTKLADVDVRSSAVQDAAMFFVDYINNLLNEVNHLCETLSLAELTQSYQAENNAKKGHDHLTSFKIVFRASPGGGLFEGTVTYDSKVKKYTMSSEISRINAYGKEKRCNVNYLQEPLCYCKTNNEAIVTANLYSKSLVYNLLIIVLFYNEFFL